MIAVFITPSSIAKSTTNAKELMSNKMHDSTQMIIIRRYGDPYSEPSLRRMLFWWNQSRPAMSEVSMRLLIADMQIVIAVGRRGGECLLRKIGILEAEQ